MLNMNTSETVIFYQLLLSGIISIIIFKIQNWIMLLKNKSLNLLIVRYNDPNSTLNVHNSHGVKLLKRL